MIKLISWIKAFWAAFIAAPIVAPLLNLLQHRSVLVLVAGFVGYSLIPQIQGLSPMWRDNLGTFVFIGVLLLSGRFTVEGILTARAGLPKTTEDYLKALLTELISPTPDSTPVAPTAYHAATPAEIKAAYPLLTQSWRRETPAPRPTLPPEMQAPNG